VAKTSTKKPKQIKAPEPKKPAAKKPATRASKIKKAVKAARVQKIASGAKKIAQNPMTTEVVAATLVAAAAALRNPKKAQALALEAADDLKKAAKSGVDGGGLWQLALDVARRSIDEIGKEDRGAKKTKKAKPKRAAKKK
jgi:hypothetical protein